MKSVRLLGRGFEKHMAIYFHKEQSDEVRNSV